MMIRRSLCLLLLSFAFSTNAYGNDYVKAALAGSACGSLGGTGVALGTPHLATYCAPLIDNVTKKSFPDELKPLVQSLLPTALAPLAGSKSCTFLLNKFFPEADDEHVLDMDVADMHVADVAHVCNAIAYFLAMHHVGGTPYGLPTLTNNESARNTALLCCLSLCAGAIMGASSSCLNAWVKERVWDNRLVVWGVQSATSYVYVSELWQHLLSLLPLKDNVLVVDALGIGYHASAALMRNGHKDFDRHLKTYRSFK